MTTIGIVDGTSADNQINLNYTDFEGDSVTDGGNDDLVFGYDGDDIISLYNGYDAAFGGNGDDRIYGHKGNNVLHGDDGQDSLYSGRHTSDLYGGSGDDLLVAQLNKGADHTLTGGEDADTFNMIGSANVKAGDVEITDFAMSEDVLQIDGTTVDFTNLPAGASLMDNADGDAVLSFGNNDTVTMTGVSSAELLGLPLPNGIVDGTEGDDHIDGLYLDGAGEAAFNVPDQHNDGGNPFPGIIVEAGDGDDLINDTAISNDGGGFIYGGNGDDTFEVGNISGHTTQFYHLYGDDDRDTFALSAPNISATFAAPVFATVMDFTPGDDFISIGGQILTQQDVGNNYADIPGTVTVSELYNGVQVTFEADSPIADPSTEAHVMQSFNFLGVTLEEFYAALPSADQVDGTDLGESINLGFTDAEGDFVTASDDFVYANGGDDTVALYGGDDVAYGGDGDDTIYGNKGNNYLFGDDGDDFLHSGRHTSDLYGGDGDDTLVAQLNKGADHVLTGGDGNDTFSLAYAVDTKTSDIIIKDFKNDDDTLVIDGDAVDFNNLPFGMYITENDDNHVVIHFSDDETVTLENVIMEGLDLGGGMVLPFVPMPEEDPDEAEADPMDLLLM